MSAAFRRVLSGTVTRLQQRVTQAEADLADQDRDPIQRVKTAKIHFNSIARMLETIDRQCAQWASSVLELRQDEKAVAQLEFDEFANQPDSYVVVAERARDMLDILDGVIIRERTSRSTHDSASHSDGTDPDVPGPSNRARRPPREPSPSSDDSAIEVPRRQARRQNPLPAFPAAAPPPGVPVVPLGQLKLPKWRMMTFGGDPHAWTSYWQSFTVAVHSQPIPAVQKMTYLLSSLKGEPLRDIQGLGVTNENYPVAVRLLVEKYGDDGELEDKIHMEMQHLPAANESLQSLIELSQSFERHCQQLQEMGVSTCNPTITALLKAKIPKGARGRLTEKEAESMN